MGETLTGMLSISGHKTRNLGKHLDIKYTFILLTA